MKRLALFVALIATPSVGMDDFEMLQVANALGAVIAAEEPCGLSYDQAAIAAYIENTVPPERMDFASALQVQIMGQQAMLPAMSSSATAAHCAAIRGPAVKFGFIAAP